MKFRGLLITVFLSSLVVCANVFAAEIVIQAGDQAYSNYPVVVAVGDVKLPAGPALKLRDGQTELPCQLIEGVEGKALYFILDSLRKNQQRVFTIEAGSVSSKNAVSITKKEHELDIKIGGADFSNYIFNSKEDWFYRPIFYPLYGPDGKAMTRNFPMAKKEGERTDHPHHQSLWVSHGEINDIDFWAIGKGKGKVVTQSIPVVEDGPVCGLFTAFNEWNSPEGQRVFSEMRTITIWGMPDKGRFLDFDLIFSASDGDVEFGDTKEGGLISLRTAHTMKVDAKQGGTILDAEGNKDGDTWGKSATWCDYTGPVEGKTVGMTIMDHPENLFSPTHYHVRTYGLFSANPFGLSYFKGKEFNGTQVLKSGSSWHFRYRVYIHADDVKASNVAGQFAAYAKMPSVDIR
jgi:hypothetical protein